MMETIKSTIDNGRYGFGVFIDLIKAFDTVNYSVLSRKLEHYGLRGTALKWFTFYLTDRQQYVSVNGHCSNYLKLVVVCHRDLSLDHCYFLFILIIVPTKQKFFHFICLQMTQIFTLSHLI